MKFTCNPKQIIIPSQWMSEYAAMTHSIDAVEVIITPVYKKRTENQNGLFYAICGQIAEQCGQSKEYVKEFIKDKAIAYGYPVKHEDNGEIMIDEKGKPIGISTAKASISQMEILIDTAIFLAKEYGYELENLNL
ncbi:MAG: hypothetical protein ACQGQO_04685 [Sphaerochaetaceae bacterium]